ncbi:MAG: Gfo/Idh/MocA family oxidoreductase [Candidatus Firestonebacteria bacterium]
MKTNNLEVTIVGGGMITAVQILPSIYQLQRLCAVGKINIVALNGGFLENLAGNKSMLDAFPGQSFNAFPDFKKGDRTKNYPDLFKDVIKKMKPYNLVVVAMPDNLHYMVVKEALLNNQHVMSVKPLVLTYRESKEVEELALKKGLFIGIEYHKRFDDRSLITRRKYRNGDFGEFLLGQAHLTEKWYYRHSNFQNWCTLKNSDTFSYIACHYIDLVAFITGLLPAEVSVYGIPDKYPNGNDGFLWTDGRVIWSNGACLNVQNSLSYPDKSPGGNSQGMTLFTKGKNDGGLISHSDQFRGVKHSFLEKGTDPGDTVYSETNPDYFQFVYRGGKGQVPVGYGYRSIEAIVNSTNRVNEAGSTAGRRKLIKEIDDEGIIATPANSFYNELVMEAGRLSIMNGGRDVVIEYGKNPKVRFKELDEYKKY